VIHWLAILESGPFTFLQMEKQKHIACTGVGKKKFAFASDFKVLKK
jgi:hypothetical protein